MQPEFTLMALSGPLQTALSIIGALIGLGIVVFVHELGHLISARRSGITVEAFSIGFGPILWHREKNGIDYRLSAIFFGGYCKLAGMEGKDDVPAHEIPGGFFAAKPAPRSLCAFSGAGMNFLFALLVFTLLWATGRVVDKADLSTTVGYVEPGLAAERAGILPGDKITRINDKPMREWKNIVYAVAFSSADTITIQLERAGEQKTIHIAPEIDKDLGARRIGIAPEMPVIVHAAAKNSIAEKIGLDKDDRIVAVVAAEEAIPIYHVITFKQTLKDNIGDTVTLNVLRHGAEMNIDVVVPQPEQKEKFPRLGFAIGFEEAVKRIDPITTSTEVIQTVYYTLRGLFTGSVKAKGLAGPVGIVNIIKLSLLSHWTIFIYMLGFISLNLGIVNLLPIPVFDGGHIFFSLSEAVTKKRVPEKVMSIVSNFFAVLIIVFFLYVTFNDIMRLRPRKDKNQAVREETLDAPDTETAPDAVTEQD